MYRPEILIHEWTRPTHMSAKMMPRPRKPYHVSVDGRALTDANGNIVRFRNYTLACNAGRAEAAKRYRPTAELIAEARMALSTLELMTSKTWIGDPNYPKQVAASLRDIAIGLARNLNA